MAAAASLERAERALHDLTIRPAGAKDVKVSGSGRYVSDYADRLAGQAARTRERAELGAFVLQFAGWAAYTAGFVGGLALVVHRVTTGRAGAGDVLLYVTLSLGLRMQIAGTVDSVRRLSEAGDVINHYLWLLGRRDTAAPAGSRPMPQRLRNGITVEGLGFRYPGSAHPSLQDVSLHLPAGRTVALVGENGSGKTTLVKLLCAAHQPSAGRVRVDGLPLSDIDTTELRSRFSAVLQDFATFEFRTAETVGVGHLSFVDDRPRITTAVADAEAQGVRRHAAARPGHATGRVRYGDAALPRPVAEAGAGPVVHAGRSAADRHGRAHGRTRPADLDPLLEFTPADEAVERFGAMRRTDFDLERHWPLKVLVTQEGGAVTEIGVVADHAAVDGWGMRMLRDDLARLVTTTRRGQDPAAAFRPGELPVQPREVAWWERTPAGRAHLERALAVWRDQLSRLRAAAVPHVGYPARAGDPLPTYRSGVMGSAVLLKAAERASAALRVPLSTLFLTALGTALCDLAGASRVGLQAHVANRMSPAHRRSASTLFLRAPLVVERTPRSELARAARALYPLQLRGAIAANVDRLRVEEIKHELYCDEPPSVLTGAWLNYQDLSDTRGDAGPLTLLGPGSAQPPADDRIRPGGVQRRGRPFVLKVFRLPDRISLHLLWQESLVPSDFAEAVLTALTERVLDLTRSL